MVRKSIQEFKFVDLVEQMRVDHISGDKIVKIT